MTRVDELIAAEMRGLARPGQLKFLRSVAARIAAAPRMPAKPAEQRPAAASAPLHPWEQTRRELEQVFNAACQALCSGKRLHPSDIARPGIADRAGE